MAKKNKNTKVNLKNKNDGCFAYAILAGLNYHKVGNHSERTTNLTLYIDDYNWQDIEFPSKSKDWKKFEKNNKSIALNILFVPNDNKDIRLAYKSEYNGKREKQVVLLMIGDGEKWHYLAVKVNQDHLEEYLQNM